MTLNHTSIPKRSTRLSDKTIHLVGSADNVEIIIQLFVSLLKTNNLKIISKRLYYQTMDRSIIDKLAPLKGAIWRGKHNCIPKFKIIIIINMYKYLHFLVSLTVLTLWNEFATLGPKHFINDYFFLSPYNRMIQRMIKEWFNWSSTKIYSEGHSTTRFL